MKRWLVFAITFILLGAAIQRFRHRSGSQLSCGFVQNVYGERVSWKNAGVIHLSVHESFPPAMYPALNNAIQDWNMALHRQVFKVVTYGAKEPARPAQDGISMIYWMSNWENNKSAEQARTSVYWVGDQISEADIRINAKEYRFYLDTPTSYSDIHLESLLVHELGHVLGLKHRDDNGSVMATYLGSRTVRNNISATDLSELSCEY